jgi:hypothetical protein
MAKRVAAAVTRIFGWGKKWREPRELASGFTPSCSLTFSQPYASASTIFLNKLNAGGFDSYSDFFDCTFTPA